MQPHFSRDRLQIRSHDVLHPADLGVFEQLAGVEPLAFPVELQRLQNHVHYDLVAELEAIGDRLLGIVDADGDTIDVMTRDAGFERRIRESMREDRRMVERGKARIARNGHGDRVRNLGGDPVPGQRRNKTNDGVRITQADGHEIGIADRREIGKTIEAAADLLDGTPFFEGIERIAAEAVADRFAHAELAAVGAENVLGSGRFQHQTKRLHL